MHDANETGDGRKEDRDRTPVTPKSSKTLQVNHFVAIQINDKQTIKNLVDEQEDFVSRYPTFKDFTVPSSSFHLTLSVLQLDTDVDIKVCIQAMNQVKTKLEDLAKKAGILTFQGLGCFNTKVIFAKVKFSDDFLVLVDAIRNTIKDAGIELEHKPLKAHVTLFNVSKSVFKDRRWYKGPLTLASYFDLDPYFGSQAINNIKVCEMGTFPTEDEETVFYKSIFNMKIA